ncbi:MAG: asparagine synthase (glutamine-hydrolyzing) [Nitrospirae bacterium]|nr:asparagine synthase (glutamine-hydrolyzing) [Nitrospirota bacterium]
MCGIAGLVSTAPVDPEAVKAMQGTLRHRGPDDEGFYISADKRAALAHRRLSIIDLSAAGRQPMEAPEGRQQGTYNGEVYNFQALRRNLEASGVEFRSKTDTETVLAGLSRRGVRSLDELRGMFALGVWSERNHELFLARDRLGKKPLYTASNGKSLAFASELKALVRGGVVERCLDPEALLSFLRFGSVYEGRTIWKGARLLQASSWMRWRGGKTESGSYWPNSLRAIDPMSYREALDRLRSLLVESTRLRLVSDVPVGVFLSGGIDSTAIVALLRMAGCPTIRTFTAGFSEKGFDESSAARRTAEAFGTEHTSRTFSADEVWDEIPRIVGAMDQPTIDGVNTYFISKVAREGGVKVALSGLGSDELFGGYPSFRMVPRLLKGSRFAHAFPGGERLGRFLLRLPIVPASYRKAEILLDGQPMVHRAYEAVRGLFPPEAVRNLFPSAPDTQDSIPTPAEIEGASLMDAISWLELRGYMLNQLLRDTDLMSMAHSLEVRCPFLDHLLVEWMLGLPEGWKSLAPPKKLLLDALEGKIPASITRRPKRGFFFPIAVWMKGPWQKRIEEILLSPHPGLTWLNQEALSGLWRRFLQDREPWARVWAMVILRLWVDRTAATL